MPQGRSPRRNKDSKAQYHGQGRVCCALYAVFTNVKNAQKIGDEQYGPQGRTGNQKTGNKGHAEYKWWDLDKNVNLLAKNAKASGIARFEFEVSSDFCGPACRNLFSQVRTKGGVRGDIPVYVFIQRTSMYYEVDAKGNVISQGPMGSDS